MSPGEGGEGCQEARMSLSHVGFPEIVMWEAIEAAAAAGISLSACHAALDEVKTKKQAAVSSLVRPLGRVMLLWGRVASCGMDGLTGLPLHVLAAASLPFLKC